MKTARKIDSTNKQLRKLFISTEYNRGDRIRTYGIRLPKTALYQAELHPVDWIVDPRGTPQARPHGWTH